MIGKTNAGGGATSKINGIIKEYMVSAENGVSAGDFVKYITSVREHKQASTACCSYTRTNPILVNDNTVLIPTPDKSTTGVSVTVVTFDGNSITVGTTTRINSHVSDHINAEALTANKVILVYGTSRSSSSNYLYAQVVTINGTEVTAGSEVKISTYANSGYRGNAIKRISDTKAFVTYLGASKTLSGQIVSIEGTTVTAGTVTQIITDATNSAFQLMQIFDVNESDYIIFYQGGTTALTYCIVNVTESSISLVQGEKFVHGTDLASTEMIIELQRNKFVAVGSMGYDLTVINIVDNASSYVQTDISDITNAGSTSPEAVAVRLRDNMVGYAYGGIFHRFRVNSDDSLELEEGASVSLTNYSFQSYEGNRMVPWPLNENVVIAFYPASTSIEYYYVGYIITGVDNVGNEVTGLTKNGGAKYDTVKVYTPNR